MKCAPRPAVLDLPASLLLSLVLVYGLIASPLMVECIPADGRSLVELIGRDPCHHPFGEMETSCTHDFSVALLGEGDPADPCVDLSLDNFGVTQNVMDVQSPPMMMANALADAAPCPAHLISTPGAGAIFKPAREPALGAVRDPRLTSSLRI
ncbi:MAG: hypothetical protein LAP85_09815 [Acidobacteriia bacterium]|nr:hypothetical protein [Terriglobia bacterium]